MRRRDEIGELGAAFEEMRKRLKESIRLQLQYEENRKQLLSHISHDLRTPLTGIKACVRRHPGRHRGDRADAGKNLSVNCGKKRRTWS